jgi:hypothetical protein
MKKTRGGGERGFERKEGASVAAVSEGVECACLSDKQNREGGERGFERKEGAGVAAVGKATSTLGRKNGPQTISFRRCPSALATFN